MCDPITAVAGLGFASTILGTVASVNTQRAQAAAADNAAQVATRQASYEASRSAADMARLLARQRAAYAAAGISGSGTPLDVGADLAGEGRTDERRILYEGALRANEPEARARLSRYGARADLLQGLTRLGSDLLGTMGQSGSGVATGVRKAPRTP